MLKNEVVMISIDGGKTFLGINQIGPQYAIYKEFLVYEIPKETSLDFISNRIESVSIKLDNTHMTYVFDSFVDLCEYLVRKCKLTSKRVAKIILDYGNKDLHDDMVKLPFSEYIKLNSEELIELCATGYIFEIING